MAAEPVTVDSGEAQIAVLLVEIIELAVGAGVAEPGIDQRAELERELVPGALLEVLRRPVIAADDARDV